MKGAPVIRDRTSIGRVNVYLVEQGAEWFVVQGADLRDYDALTLVTNFEGAAIRSFPNAHDAFIAFEKIRERRE